MPFFVVGSAGISSRDRAARYAVVFFVVGSAGISSRDRAARYAVVFLWRAVLGFHPGIELPGMPLFFWHVGRCVFVVGRDGISPRDGAARVTVCIS